MEIEIVKHVRNPRDLATIFSADDKFLGVFECDEYKLTRKFIEGKGVSMRLYYNHMEPTTQPKKATLCIIHGFGEHSSKFLDFAEYFVLKGFDVHLVDLRGFGYSGGARGVSLMEDMISDIETCMLQTEEGLPIFLFGHSLGGLLVTSLAERNPHLQITGIIANAPLLGLPKDRDVDAFKLFALKACGDFLGDIVANSMINLTALTKNDQYIRAALEDRLMIPFLGLIICKLFDVRAKMAKSMLWSIEIIQKQAKNFIHPLFVMHGNSDFITNHLDSILFYNNCSSKDKTIKIFEGGYHQMQHDSQLKEIQLLLSNWMEQRIPSGVKFSKKFQMTYCSHLQAHFAVIFIIMHVGNEIKIILMKRDIKRVFLTILGFIIYLILIRKISKKYPQVPLLKRVLFPLFVGRFSN